jgi:hypothetical protein
MDDYLDGVLRQRECTLLENHLARCPRCAEELRKRPVLDRDLRRALAASVQGLSLSPEASAQILNAAEESLRRTKRNRRVIRSFQLLAAMVVLALFAVSLYFWSEGIPDTAGSPLVSLLPANSLALADGGDPLLTSAPRSATPLEAPVFQSLPRASLLFEPRNLNPRAPYTMTVFLRSDRVEPVDSVRLELDITGPTGYYRFDMSVKGPLPAQGVSMLRLTPELLETSCQERYLLSATEVFSAEGTYNLRLTVSLP